MFVPFFLSSSFLSALPGSKELMLEQRIPATYLALEDVIGLLATKQKSCGRDPVLSSEQYRVGATHRSLFSRSTVAMRHACSCSHHQRN
jgi:hypothetical protein